MKTINYTGSSKLISRIVHLLNRKAPLPLDGQGDVDWGTNGQVLTTDGNGNTSWTTPQGGGGDVTDVEVNGTSVVNAQGVAEVSVPTKTSDLNNDSGFIDSTDLSTALGDYTPTASLASVATSGLYSDLSGTPSLATVATSGDYDDLTNKPTIPTAQVNSDWNAVSGVAEILNKPTIPTALADLSEDTTHRVVTDTEKSAWNGKVGKKTTLDTYYGTCPTAAATAAKVITVTDTESNFSLRAGVVICVKFTYTNTANDPTFNVNNTGAKSVWYNTALITTGSLGFGGTANRPMQFTYDGTQWVFTGWSYNQSYSNMSASELATGTATTGRSISAKVLTDWNTAAHTTYDHTASGLSATDAQGAIDALNAMFGTGSGRANRMAYREEITSITADMWASISNGDFEKVHVGMHYTAPSGRTYWFADADYFYGSGIDEQTNHHMLVIEDEISHTAKHQTSNTTSGGARDSLIYSTTLPGIQSELETDFGASHIKAQSILFSISSNSSGPSNWGWVRDKVAILMNARMVFGSPICNTGNTNEVFNAGNRARQLSLFQAMPETLHARIAGGNTRANWWLDDVESSALFGYVYNEGNPDRSNASSDLGIRRAFLIG